MELNIITRCTRPKFLREIKQKIFDTDLFLIKWWVIFDITKVKKVDTELLKILQSDLINVIFFEGGENKWGADLIDETLSKIKNGWVYILDDDNQIHEEFFSSIYDHINSNQDKECFVFHQKVSGKDFTGLDIRITKENDVKVGKIDTAQFVIKRSLIGDLKYDTGGGYVADGVFIEKIHSHHNLKFHIIDKVLCHYNFFQRPHLGFLPKVLLVGDDTEMKTKKGSDFESDQLLQMNLENDHNINEEISKFDPDAIITIGDDFGKFPILSYHSLDVRRRWLHFNQMDPEVGECAFQCAMNFILSRDSDGDTPLISFFTPTFNTGKTLWRTFESVKNQSYSNWEWVIVDDSTDEGFTLSIAEEMSKIDCRVKVYSFHRKSGGIVGESKWRSAAMCRGKWIVELDHDDCFTYDAAELCVRAFKQYTDCKFVYSDCVEVDNNHNSLTYGDGFSFGYGSYREVEYQGRKWQVANSSNINPKTIRHIVGVPNHFRAWDRDFYFSIGGYNRRLSIADDYELLVRTFLHTRMVKIPKMLYIQYYHGSNTQNASRSDIQRRVRWISSYYNHQIRDRFEALGVKDWAWERNPQDPIMTESRFGESEGRVNYIMDLDQPVYQWNPIVDHDISYSFKL